MAQAMHRGLSCHSSGLVFRKLSLISTVTKNIRNTCLRSSPRWPAASSRHWNDINDGSHAHAWNEASFPVLKGNTSICIFTWALPCWRDWLYKKRSRHLNLYVGLLVPYQHRKGATMTLHYPLGHNCGDPSQGSCRNPKLLALQNCKT